MVLGIASLASIGGWDAFDDEWLAALSVVALVIGANRGMTVELSVRNGVLWFRYTAVSVTIGAAWFVLHDGVDWLLAKDGSDIGTASSLFVTGITFLGEAVTVASWALSTGVDFRTRRRTRASETSGVGHPTLDHSSTVGEGIDWLKRRIGGTGGDASRDPGTGR